MLLTKEEFLIQHLTEGKSYMRISEDYNIIMDQLRVWWKDGLEIREEIKRANKLFNARKGKDEFSEFEELGKRGFYEWFRNQPKHCHYCKIEELILEKLFAKETGTLRTKRGRGRVLELERRNSNLNQYSPKNCVLACYLCNNHKSDLISEEDHMRYFAPEIRRYLEDKYLKYNDQVQG